MAQNAHSHRKLKIAGIVALVVVIALFGFAGNFLFDFALNPRAPYTMKMMQDGKDDKAFEIFRKSAENGYPASMGWLAACYENGYGTERNREMAKFWLTRAADLGDRRP
jgi:TPR repeat protein